MTTCSLCHEEVAPLDGVVLYNEPGGREAGSRNRQVVHGRCIADDAEAGLVVRVSPFAFEAAEGQGAPR